MPPLVRNAARPQWHTCLPRFEVARPDHVRVESSSCCLPKELSSFVRPRELLSFDLTRDPFSSNRKTSLSWEV